MSNIKNQPLQAAEDGIERQLKHGTRYEYLRLVVAGMDAAMHGGRNSIFVSLKTSHKGRWVAGANRREAAAARRRRQAQSQSGSAKTD